MRAVILAAGRGSRLECVAGVGPKCLAPFGEETLIERQLRALRRCGIDRVTVVVGHQAASVGEVCGARADLLHNERHATTNSLYSLWLARDVLGGGFVVLNGDVLFHPQLLSDLLTSRYDDALLMSAPQDGQVYSDEEMKVCVRGGRVAAIAKTLAPDMTDGENIGIAKFGVDGAAVLIEELDRLVFSGGTRHWLPAAFAPFARRRPLYVVESRGFPWIDIDFPEDYWHACHAVMPDIDAVPEGAASHV